MASTHKFAIKFWTQGKVFQKTWLKVFLDLHSIDSYKKLTTHTHIYPCHELHMLHKEKVNSCNWFAGITPKKDKRKEKYNLL